MIRKIMLKLCFSEVSSKTPAESSGGKKTSSMLYVHGLAADLLCDYSMQLKATVFKQPSA